MYWVQVDALRPPFCLDRKDIIQVWQTGIMERSWMGWAGIIPICLNLVEKTSATVVT